MPPSLSHLDFNLLIVLDALLQERGVSKAAVRVGRSQPAISHALQRLRGLFRDELLVRVGQRYELTAAAQAIADPLHVSLRQLNEVLAARPTFDPQNAERQFKIGASDYVAAVLLRPAIQKLATSAPGISLSIEPPPEEDVGGSLRNGQQDLTFFPVDKRPKAADLCFDAILHDTFCCVAWRGNQTIEDRLTRKTFEAAPQIIDLHGTSPEQGPIGRLLAVEGIHRRHIVRTNYILLMPFLIEGTPALAVLPRRLAEWLCQRAALRVLSLPFKLPDWVMGMCWSSRHTTDPAHLWLRNFLKETASKLPQKWQASPKRPPRRAAG